MPIEQPPKKDSDKFDDWVVRLRQLMGPLVFTAPTYQNSWVDFGGALQVGGYTKDGFGVVRLRGTIKNGTIGLAAFTLPSGYRPTATITFAVPSNAAFGVVSIDSSGVVTPTVGSNASVNLTGITFSTS